MSSSSEFEIDAPADADASNNRIILNHRQWNVVMAAASSSSNAASAVERSSSRQLRSCNRCWTAGCSWLTSALGVSILLLVYLITGAIMFMILGSGSSQQGQQQEKHHHHPAGRTSSSSASHGDEHYSSANDPADGRLLEKTMATVDRLWSITEDLNILYRDNWTHLARVEMRHYQDQLVGTLRQIMLEERYSFKQTWTFPMSLLYALTLITTIGYGFYTPSTLLAECLTTAYSLLGIPLFLLYLSVVGERLARIINRMTLSCCCCNDNNMMTAVISSAAGDASADEDDDDENAASSRSSNNINRGTTTRIGAAAGAYRQYSDVTALTLQPMSSSYRSGSNGHLVDVHHQRQQTDIQHQQLNNIIKDAADDDDDRNNIISCCCCAAADTTQVPLLVCAALLAVFVGFASFLLVLFEPQLGFFGSLHLTINLLMTLGFAGNLLPGMSAETIIAAGDSTADGHHQQQQQSRHHQGSIGSQMSLIIVACLILVGTTLLSSSFSVLMDNIGHHHSNAGISRSASVLQAAGAGRSSSRRWANNHISIRSSNT